MSWHDPMTAPVEACADAAYNATVLERVLLAIINAHPTADAEGRKDERLDMAMTALIGSARSNRCDEALLFMAQERQRDACDFEMAMLRRGNGCGPRVRSTRELAELAAREVLGCTASGNIRIVARQLCELFPRQRVRTVEPDYVQEALEAEAVKRLCDELAEWGVPTRP